MLNPKQVMEIQFELADWLLRTKENYQPIYAVEYIPEVEEYTYGRLESIACFETREEVFAFMQMIDNETLISYFEIPETERPLLGKKEEVVIKENT